MKFIIQEKEISRSELTNLNKKMLLLSEVLIIAMIHANNELSKSGKEEVSVLNLHFSNVLDELKKLASFLERSRISDIL